MEERNEGFREVRKENREEKEERGRENLFNCWFTPQMSQSITVPSQSQSLKLIQILTWMQT